MIVSGLGALLVAAAADVPARPPAAAADARVEYAQLSIREQIIIRVPMRRVIIAPQVTYRDSKAARCQPTAGMAGAVVVRGADVDFVYRGGLRIRAELERVCPSLDFDSGFYVLPTKDKQLCAGRDAIHARAGGECQIKRFRKLVPEVAGAKRR